MPSTPVALTRRITSQGLGRCPGTAVRTRETFMSVDLCGRMLGRRARPGVLAPPARSALPLAPDWYDGCRRGDFRGPPGRPPERHRQLREADGYASKAPGSHQIRQHWTRPGSDTPGHRNARAERPYEASANRVTLAAVTDRLAMIFVRNRCAESPGGGLGKGEAMHTRSHPCPHNRLRRLRY